MVNGAVWLLGIVWTLVGVGPLFILAAIIHALGVVHNYYADQRARRGTM